MSDASSTTSPTTTLNQNTRKQKGKKDIRFNNRRNLRRGKRLRNNVKGRKKSRQSNTCDKDQAFVDYKKAVEYKKKIDRVVKFVKQLEKKSTNLSPIKNYTELFGLATDNGTTCTPEAKDAYEFLLSCSDTIPTLCSPPDISIKEAEECTNDTTSSFAKFAKCATKKNSDLCECYTDFNKQFPANCEAFVNKTTEVTDSRKLCMNSTVKGSFSNCMQFIKTEVPMILEECSSCTVVDTTTATTAGSTTTYPNSTTGPTTTGTTGLKEPLFK